ncbi:MAG: helix-turn-helix domain-containing protein [Chitinispirillales bacterium]|jgi:transposase|nr:helix-turn-helix domain-containing protein [Chitinispirillales bacterium]
MENELKTNAKHLSPEEQYQIRKSIIRLSKQGKKVKEIAEILDVNERHVKATRVNYRINGIAGINLKRRGRKSGFGRRLCPDQEKEIRNLILDRNPEQLKLRGCIWTRKNIAELIKRLYRIDMPFIAIQL